MIAKGTSDRALDHLGTSSVERRDSRILRHWKEHLRSPKCRGPPNAAAHEAQYGHKSPRDQKPGVIYGTAWAKKLSAGMKPAKRAASHHSRSKVVSPITTTPSSATFA